MSEKISFELTDEQFRSITVNALADMQAEFATLRSFILQRLAKLGGVSDEEINAEFKKELKRARADIMVNFFTDYGR